MLKHSFGIGCFATACLLSGVTALQAAPPMVPDYPCYIQRGATQVVDLTRSVCRFESDRQATAASIDAAYLSSLKHLLQSNDDFSQLINTQPEMVVATAQTYCAARQAGMSEEQYIESQFGPLANPVGTSLNDDSQQMKRYEAAVMAIAVAAEFAPNHYAC